MPCARFIAVLALTSTAVLADTSVRTETSSGKDAEIYLEAMLAPSYKPLLSVRVDRCVAKLYPLKRTHPYAWHRVQGCALSIAAGDFAKLLANLRSPVTHRAVALVKPSTPVPAVGASFDVTDVYFSSPPEAWSRNDPLIYTNSSRTRIVVYAYYLVEE